MSPDKIRAVTVVQRTDLVHDMLRGIASVPLGSLEDFSRDDRLVAAAESYLRRALLALLDLGRHILAKGFGDGALEYKQVATALGKTGLLDVELTAVLVEMAGYRNRLARFYDEVSTSELYEICATRTDDVRRVLEALLEWLRLHPESVDGEL